jgi:2-oxoglutarate dehydrogenase E2 component (dihydrolipoamide succinyltransferase)
MARIDVIMPQMGESIAEGTLSKWLKKVGDAVKRDEPIFEISTDKVDAEIPAPNAGVIAEVLVTEGQTVADDASETQEASEITDEAEPVAEGDETDADGESTEEDAIDATAPTTAADMTVVAAATGSVPTYDVPVMPTLPVDQPVATTCSVPSIVV